MKITTIAYSALGVSSMVACSSPPSSSSSQSWSGSSTVSPQAAAALITSPSAPTTQVAYVVTTPNASCSIGPTGQTSPKGAVLADTRGVVRFYAPPTTWGTRLSLDCSDPHDGATASYSVDLTSSATFSPPASSKIPPPSKSLPALDGDPESYTQDELVGAGYPPRPPKSSRVYATWLAAVSNGTTVVDPLPKSRLDHFNSNTSTDWGGQGLCGITCKPPITGTTYVAGIGEFFVPSLNSGQDGRSFLTNTSLWLGLGGVKDQALIQAGVEMWDGYGISPEYDAWIEYWPKNYMQVSLGSGGQGGAGVSANDEILVEVWACNSTGAINASGGWGCYFIQNVTTNKSTGTLFVQAPNTFNGGTAEAMMESYYHLQLPMSDYTSTWMAWVALDSSLNGHDLATDTSWATNLVDSQGTTLTTVGITGTATATAWIFNAAQ